MQNNQEETSGTRIEITDGRFKGKKFGPQRQEAGTQQEESGVTVMDGKLKLETKSEGE